MSENKRRMKYKIEERNMRNHTRFNKDGDERESGWHARHTHSENESESNSEYVTFSQIDVDAFGLFHFVCLPAIFKQTHSHFSLFLLRFRQRQPAIQPVSESTQRWK